jgi:hypothetical protein
MTRPVYGDPEFRRAATAEEIAALAEESGCPPEPDPARAGWDLTFGCRLNAGRDLGGALVVDVHLSDYDGTGAIRRTVTPDQLLSHAAHLARVAADELGAIRDQPAGPFTTVGRLLDSTIANLENVASATKEPVP